MQRLAPLASSSPDAGIKSARCFQHNFLKLLFQQQQYTALDQFLRYELYKNTAIKFKADAWNPCIVYAAPHALCTPCIPWPALCSCRDINSKPLVLCNRDRHFNFWVVVYRPLNVYALTKHYSSLANYRCIQPARVKVAQSIRVDWDLPGHPPSSSESVIERFNLIASESLNLYKGFKFNAPLNTVAFATMTCSGPGFSGVDSGGTDVDEAVSYSRSLCLSHLDDADVSTRTYLSLSKSETTDTPLNPQIVSLPSSQSYIQAFSRAFLFPRSHAAFCPFVLTWLLAAGATASISNKLLMGDAPLVAVFVFFRIGAC